MSHKAFAAPLNWARGFEMKQIQRRYECREKKKRICLKFAKLAFE
jgi:hypothetical protein